MQNDIAFWSSLVLYLNNVGAGNDGLHNAITSFYMWAWDANADDTYGSGGLVASDWESLNWQKLGALIGNNTQFTYGLDLTPWYMPGFVLPSGEPPFLPLMCMITTTNPTKTWILFPRQALWCHRVCQPFDLSAVVQMHDSLL